MRQTILLISSIIALGALPSACGTKGPLTLPPKTPAATTAQPATAPVTDANTATGQH